MADENPKGNEDEKYKIPLKKTEGDEDGLISSEGKSKPEPRKRTEIDTFDYLKSTRGSEDEPAQNPLETVTGNMFARLRSTPDYRNAMRALEAAEPFVDPFAKTDDLFSQGPSGIGAFQKLDLECMSPDYVPQSVTDINDAIAALEETAKMMPLDQRDQLLQRVFAYRLAVVDFDWRVQTKVQPSLSRKKPEFGSSGSSEENNREYRFGLGLDKSSFGGKLGLYTEPYSRPKGKPINE